MLQDIITYRKNIGDMPKDNILVETSVCYIPERIREIDNGFFVMFSPSRQVYELHHKDQDFTYCLTFPYEELDARAIEFIHETSMQRKEKIMAEIERNQRQKEESEYKKIMEDAKYRAAEIHQYALRHSEEKVKEAFGV